MMIIVNSNDGMDKGGAMSTSMSDFQKSTKFSAFQKSTKFDVRYRFMDCDRWSECKGCSRYMLAQMLMDESLHDIVVIHSYHQSVS